MPEGPFGDARSKLVEMLLAARGGGGPPAPSPAPSLPAQGGPQMPMQEQAPNISSMRRDLLDQRDFPVQGPPPVSPGMGPAGAMMQQRSPFPPQMLQAIQSAAHQKPQGPASPVGAPSPPGSPIQRAAQRQSGNLQSKGMRSAPTQRRAM